MLGAIFIGLITGLFGVGTGFSLMYLVGAEPIEDPEVHTLVEGVRHVCRSLDLKGCDAPLTLLWKDDPLDYYAGMAPLMRFRHVPQIILVDKTHWNELEFECRRELIGHEMGHALLGWEHHEDVHSIMLPGFTCREDLMESFRRAKEIEND